MAKKRKKKAKSTTSRKKRASTGKKKRRVVTHASKQVTTSNRRRRRSKKVHRRRRTLYAGNVSNRGINLKALNGFDLKSLKQYAEPALFIAAGFIGGNILNKNLLKKFISSNEPTSVIKKYGVLIRALVQFGAGLAVAGFTKDNRIKLAGMGVGIGGLSEFITSLIGGSSFGVAASDGMSVVGQRGAVRKIGGAARSVGANPFRIDGVGDTHSFPSAPWHTRGQTRVLPHNGVSTTNGKAGTQFPV